MLISISNPTCVNYWVIINFLVQHSGGFLAVYMGDRTLSSVTSVLPGKHSRILKGQLTSMEGEKNSISIDYEACLFNHYGEGDSDHKSLLHEPFRNLL